MLLSSAVAKNAAANSNPPPPPAAKRHAAAAETSGGTPKGVGTQTAKIESKDGQKWAEILSALQSQVLEVLESVEKDKVEVTVGRTAVRKDKAVVLAWNRQQNLTKLIDSGADEDGDGVLLYLAIRHLKEEKENSGDAGEKLVHGEDRQALQAERVVPNNTPLGNDENNNSQSNKNEGAKQSTGTDGGAAGAAIVAAGKNGGKKPSKSGPPQTVKKNGKIFRPKDEGKTVAQKGQTLESSNASQHKKEKKENHVAEKSQNSAAQENPQTKSGTAEKTVAKRTEHSQTSSSAKTDEPDSSLAASSAEIESSEQSVITADKKGAKQKQEKDKVEDKSGGNDSCSETSSVTVVESVRNGASGEGEDDWTKNVTVQRNASATDVKNIFVDDKFRRFGTEPESSDLFSDLHQAESDDSTSSSAAVVEVARPSSILATRPREKPSAGTAKKSVRWRERLEESSDERPSSSASSASTVVAARSPSKVLSRQSRLESFRNRSARQASARKERKRGGSLESARTDAHSHHPHSSSSHRRIPLEGQGQVNLTFNRPLRRSRSVDLDDGGPIAILTSTVPSEDDPKPKWARVPHAYNMIRRMRSKHVPAPQNLWFTGPSQKSFNSRCSPHYDLHGLDEDRKQYFYFRSLPRVTNTTQTL